VAKDFGAGVAEWRSQAEEEMSADVMTDEAEDGTGKIGQPVAAAPLMQLLLLSAGARPQ